MTLTKNLGLLLLSSAIALLLGELALRALWHNSYSGERAYVVDLRLQPASRAYLLDRSLLDPDEPLVPIRTDERSYLLPSFRHDRPDVTVAFLGGSTTECAAVRENLRWPALVGTYLAETGLNVNTLNAAHSGNTLHDSINILLNHVAQDRPDLVVLMNATNDVGLLVQKGSYEMRSGRPLSFEHVVRWTKQTASSWSYVAALLRRALADPAARPFDNAAGLARRNDPTRAEKIPTDLYVERLRAFVGVTRGLGAQPILLTQPLADIRNEFTPAWADLNAQERFNEFVRRVGRELDVPVIDLAREIAATPGWNEPMKVFYDGMHVTDEGSRLYARVVADRLEPIIRSVGSERGEGPHG